MVGVALGHDAPTEDTAAAAAEQKPLTVDLDATDSPYLADRASTVSRSAQRVTLQKKPTVKRREWMTSNLNLWATPQEKGKPLDVLEAGHTVAVTGLVKAGFAQILYDDQVRWVNADYLSEDKPKPPEPEPEPPPPPPPRTRPPPAPPGCPSRRARTGRAPRPG